MREREVWLKAFTLKSVQLSEHDESVSVFTLEKGLLRLRVKGVRKLSSRLRYGLLPGTCSKIKVVGLEKWPLIAGVQVISQVSLQGEGVTVWYWLLELTLKGSLESSPNPRLFALFEELLTFTDWGENVSVLWLCAQITFRWLLVNGFAVTLPDEQGSWRLDLPSGGFVFDPYGRFLPETTLVLKEMSKSSGLTSKAPFSADTIMLINDALVELAEYHLQRKLNRPWRSYIVS